MQRIRTVRGVKHIERLSTSATSRSEKATGLRRGPTQANSHALRPHRETAKASAPAPKASELILVDPQDLSSAISSTVGTNVVWPNYLTALLTREQRRERCSRETICPPSVPSAPWSSSFRNCCHLCSLPLISYLATAITDRMMSDPKTKLIIPKSRRLSNLFLSHCCFVLGLQTMQSILHHSQLSRKFLLKST